jgi:hypothetical protein
LPRSPNPPPFFSSDSASWGSRRGGVARCGSREPALHPAMAPAPTLPSTGSMSGMGSEARAKHSSRYHRTLRPTPGEGPQRASRQSRSAPPLPIKAPRAQGAPGALLRGDQPHSDAGCRRRECC